MSDSHLENTKKEGAEWLAVFDITTTKDLAEIQRRLAAVHDDKLVIVVRSPAEAKDAIRRGVSQILNKPVDDPEVEKKLKELNPKECIWDYYMMAVYESACGTLGDKEPEFTKRSLFPAFQAGLGFIINLGSLLIGVALPIAKRDEEMRIHSETGPAIIWGENKQYWWHGVSISPEWIEKREELTPEMYLQEQNQERRRVLSDLIGWEKIVKHLGTQTLHHDDYGELLQVEMDDDDGKPALFVRVTCPSTGRVYMLRVAPDTETAKEGVASTFGVDVEQYNPQEA